RITGNYIDVLVAGVAADIRHPIQRFHDLTGPAVSDLRNKWEAGARPPFQIDETLRAILSLPRLVIFDPNDEHIALLVARESHVMLSHRPGFRLLLFRSPAPAPDARVLEYARAAQAA